VNDVLNPVDVERAIGDLANRITAGVRTVSERYEMFLTADRAYDQAFAHAYLNADGPAHERKYEAELATTEHRKNRDVADAAFRYADRTAKALENELRAYQSIGASVRAMYGTTQGVGR
jgi:hypothetical protein